MNVRLDLYSTEDLDNAAELLAEQGYDTFAGAVSEASKVLEAAALSPATLAVPGDVEPKAGWTLSSDNYKRWMIVGPDGLWTMQPVGMISSSEAESICRSALSGQSSLPAGRRQK